VGVDLRDYIEVVTGSGLAGAAAAVPLSLVLVVFLYRAVRRAERQRTRRQDAVVVVRMMCAFFLVATGVGAYVAHASQTSAPRCNAVGANDYVSPDHRHKVVLFTVVCGGATKDSGTIPEASSAVSLLRGNESAPKHAGGNILNRFLSFHTEKDSVSWSDNTHVRVVLRGGFNVNRDVENDGVTVQLRTAP
jgi:hypothetical protein